MRRTLKVALWVAIFAACAGVGAFIASRTNPFPPGVQDPGARSATPDPTPTATATPTPAGVAWAGHMQAGTSHHLFVGGSCSTAWRIELDFSVDPLGKVKGTGTAHLVGHLRCDFPTAQVQARALQLAVSGRHANGRMALKFVVKDRVPLGSNDYGGLIHTLPQFPPMEIHAGSIDGPVQVQVSDGDQGSYVASYQVALSCQDC
jgi:hypothetical protein